jgi:hypothetical protein
MNKRIKKKLLKRKGLSASTILDIPVDNPTFCKVLATKEELEYVGCDLDLTGCEVEYIKDYPTGYSQIRIQNKEFTELLEKPIYESYDIPKYFLEFK